MDRARDRNGPDLKPAGLTAPGRSPGDGRYFDELVQESGDFNPFTDRGWRTLARRFADVVGAGEPRSVLDVGCGTGRSHAVYDGRSPRYVGLDLSFGALRRASLRRSDLAWLQADATATPFADETFDVVAFSSVLHHLPDRGAALAEAIRILRPGGLVFAFDPNLLHPAMFLFRNPRSPFYRSAGVTPDERPLPPTALRRDFHDAGLAGIRQRCQSDIPYASVAPRGMRIWLPLYNQLDRLWEALGLGRWFGVFVITWARKP